MVLLYKLSAVLLLWPGTGSGPATGSSTGVTRTQVDLIELNHFMDDEGREVFQQVIFYDWCKPKQQFHVRAWRLIKKQNQLPIRHWNPKCYQCTWHDGPLLRQVRASKLRETWSQQDPERVNRELLAEDQRLPLFPPRIARKPNAPSTTPRPVTR
jgi:hypothetical protein